MVRLPVGVICSWVRWEEGEGCGCVDAGGSVGDRKGNDSPVNASYVVIQERI